MTKSLLLLTRRYQSLATREQTLKDGPFFPLCDRTSSKLLSTHAPQSIPVDAKTPVSSTSTAINQISVLLNDRLAPDANINFIEWQSAKTLPSITEEVGKTFVEFDQSVRV